MQYLLLRLEAPLMSFGAVRVDQHNPTDRFPGRAQLTGMLANALGWYHEEFDRLQDLQERIQFACRWDISPQSLRDYQTVDLGQSKMAIRGWTTSGKPEHRAGGTAKSGIHERFRYYWANGALTVALTLREGTPSLSEIAEALKKPARPLFIGRKACLPASRIFLGIREGNSSLDVIKQEPAHWRVASTEPVSMDACWPANIGEDSSETLQTVFRSDDRNWRKQIHVGQRAMIEGVIWEVPPCT